MPNVHFILESRMSKSDAHTALKSLVEQQRAAHLKAWKRTFESDLSYREQEEYVQDVIKEYRATLEPLIIKLHSLGYPIIRFYIEHLIFIHVRNEHRYMSVLHTLRTYLHHYQGRTKLCSQKHLQDLNKPKLCGIVHIQNIQDPVSRISIFIKKRIRVPHMFYIHIQFLEILLVGGVTENACKDYQSFKIWCITVYPFAAPIPEQPLFTFCGSHPPFTTIIPGNFALVETRSVVVNRLASIKFKYSAADMLVSDIMLNVIQSIIEA